MTARRLFLTFNSNAKEVLCVSLQELEGEGGGCE